MLRLKPGDAIEVIYRETAASFHATIIAIAQDAITVKLVELLATKSSPVITLIVGMIKPNRIDFLVEKSIECGASRICLFVAERSQRKLAHEERENRRLRLERVVEASIKQSGPNALFPTIMIEEDLKQALRSLHLPQSPPSRRIVLEPLTEGDDRGAFPSLISCLTEAPEITLQHLPENAETYLIIGPEGGLAEGERLLATKHGYLRATLGSKTLRTETAAIVATAVVHLLLGEQSSGLKKRNL